MVVSSEQFKAWLTTPTETENLEFKTASNNFHFEKLVDYCVALANEGGGHLVLGVTDSPPRQVVGTKAFDVPERTTSGIHERLRIKVSSQELDYEGKRVLIFEIPSRPKGRPVEHEGRYWMRAGESLVPMTPDQLQKIFDEGQPDPELSVAKDQLDASEVIRLLDTQLYFELLDKPYPESRQEVIEVLLREKILVSDKPYGITVFGALLFARDLSDFENLEKKAIRTTKYIGNNKVEIERDHFDRKGYAVGFEGLVDFVNSQLPSNEVIQQAIREQAPMYPGIAVRELLANALIHQDLADNSHVNVSIYANRFEISNPGHPSIEPNRFLDEYHSRNPKLSDLMRRMGICEALGSGIDRVVVALEAFQLPSFDVRVDSKRTTVILFPHQNLEEMGRGDKIRACYQHCALKYILNEKMTNKSFRERLGLTDRQTDVASRIIGMTTDEDLIKLEDPTSTSKRYAKYVPFWA